MSERVLSPLGHVKCQNAEGGDNSSGTHNTPDCYCLRRVAEHDIGDEDEDNRKKVSDGCDHRTPQPQQDLRKGVQTVSENTAPRVLE